MVAIPEKKLSLETQYKVVKYDSAFKDEVVKLQRHLWSPDLSLNSTYFSWKYDLNPYSSEPLIYLALAGGNIIGMRGFYAGDWRVGQDRALPALCAGDLVVAPGFRDRGVYTLIMNEALKDLQSLGYSYVFNWSASPVTFLGALAMGWRSIGFLEMMTFRSKSNAVKNFSPMSFFRSVPEEEYPFYYFDASRDEPMANVKIRGASLPEQMAKLTARVETDGRIRHVRDEQYFGWRFRNPLSDYRFLFWGEEVLQGYLVLQAQVYARNNMVTIVDWEATNLTIREELLTTAVRLGNFPGLRIWTSGLLQEEKEILERNGFGYNDLKRGVAQYNPKVLVKPTSDRITETSWQFEGHGILEQANWDLRMIYSDAF